MDQQLPNNGISEPPVPNASAADNSEIIQPVGAPLPQAILPGAIPVGMTTSFVPNMLAAPLIPNLAMGGMGITDPSLAMPSLVPDINATLPLLPTTILGAASTDPATISAGMSWSLNQPTNQYSVLQLT